MSAAVEETDTDLKRENSPSTGPRTTWVLMNILRRDRIMMFVQHGFDDQQDEDDAEWG